MSTHAQYATILPIASFAFFVGGGISTLGGLVRPIESSIIYEKPFLTFAGIAGVISEDLFSFPYLHFLSLKNCVFTFLLRVSSSCPRVPAHCSLQQQVTLIGPLFL